MKIFRILWRNICDSFKGVFRNFSLSMASISCITITLILVGFSILLSYNVNSFTKDIESDLTIVVFINKETTQEQVDEVGVRINSLSNILSVTFESKEEVRKSMQNESEVF